MFSNLCVCSQLIVTVNHPGGTTLPEKWMLHSGSSSVVELDHNANIQPCCTLAKSMSFTVHQCTSFPVTVHHLFLKQIEKQNSPLKPPIFSRSLWFYTMSFKLFGFILQIKYCLGHLKLNSYDVVWQQEKSDARKFISSVIWGLDLFDLVVLPVPESEFITFFIWFECCSDSGIKFPIPLSNRNSAKMYWRHRSLKVYYFQNSDLYLQI